MAVDCGSAVKRLKKLGVPLVPKSLGNAEAVPSTPPNNLPVLRCNTSALRKAVNLLVQFAQT